MNAGIPLWGLPHHSRQIEIEWVFPQRHSRSICLVGTARLFIMLACCIIKLSGFFCKILRGQSFVGVFFFNVGEYGSY
jgi:hypothetical protein